MYKLLLIFALAMFSTGVPAQVLWRDVQVGATVEQVEKMLPGVQHPAEPQTLVAGTMVGLLELEGFQLADLDFKATFYFKDRKVDRIFLNPVARPSGLAARVAAIKVRDALLAKYGKPVSTEDNKGLLGATEVAKWVSNQTIIRFSFNQYGDDSEGFLQVIYMAPQDTNNL